MPLKLIVCLHVRKGNTWKHRGKWRDRSYEANSAFPKMFSYDFMYQIL